jgi:hypothetical protein
LAAVNDMAAEALARLKERAASRKENRSDEDH